MTQVVDPAIIHEGARGSVAVTGAALATMSPNEIVSMVAGGLTALYVLAQLVTLLPRLLDSIKELKRRSRGTDDSEE